MTRKGSERTESNVFNKIGIVKKVPLTQSKVKLKDNKQSREDLSEKSDNSLPKSPSINLRKNIRVG